MSSKRKPSGKPSMPGRPIPAARHDNIKMALKPSDINRRVDEMRRKNRSA